MHKWIYISKFAMDIGAGKIFKKIIILIEKENLQQKFVL